MLGTAIKDRTRWWSFEDLLLILLLGAILYLPGLGQVPLFDRDEPRFASAAREMMTSGNYLVPHFNGELRPDKPPLVYWLMNVTYRLVGPNELGARLPSAICGTLTLLVVYLAAGARFGRVTGIVAALMLGTTAVYIAESRLATADATMLLFTVIAMAGAWHAWDAGTRPPQPVILPRAESLHSPAPNLDPTIDRTAPTPLWLALTFWTALALATLAKGVPLLFVLVPMIVLSIATAPAWTQWRTQPWRARLFHFPVTLARAIVAGNWSWWRQLRPWFGVPLLIAIVGAWVAATCLTAAGRDLLYDMVVKHFLLRSVGPALRWLGFNLQDLAGPGGQDPMKAYRKPPGFYLALVWGTFWPWSVLLVPAAFHTIRRMLGRTALAIDRRPYQFLFAWVVPMWIALELAQGKLVHYVLPLYVAMAILCADALVQSWHRLTDVLAAPWVAAARWLYLCIWLGLAAAALFVLPALLWDHEATEVFWLTLPMAGALAATGVAGAIAWGRPAWPFVTVLGFAAALLLGNTMVVPSIAELQMTKNAMAQARHWRDQGCLLLAAGRTEPTLIYYAGYDPTAQGLPLKDSPLAPDLLATVWNPGPKHSTLEPTRESRGNAKGAGMACCVVMDRQSYDALAQYAQDHPNTIQYHRVATIPGFRTDTRDRLKNWWSPPASPPPPCTQPKAPLPNAICVVLNYTPGPTTTTAPATTRRAEE